MAKAPERTPATRTRPQSAYDLMRSLTEDFDRTFGEFFGHRRWPFSGLMPAGTSGTWAPPIETEEKEGKLYVRAELPGLSKEDVKVEVADDMLTIEGERKQESEKRERGYYRSERSYGYFSRSVALPEGANAETAKASFKDGMLEIAIDLPARKTPDRRRLTIGD
jgi:HSP20 family protein